MKKKRARKKSTKTTPVQQSRSSSVNRERDILAGQIEMVLLAVRSDGEGEQGPTPKQNRRRGESAIAHSRRTNPREYLREIMEVLSLDDD